MIKSGENSESSSKYLWFHLKNNIRCPTPSFSTLYKVMCVPLQLFLFLSSGHFCLQLFEVFKGTFMINKYWNSLLLQPFLVIIINNVSSQIFYSPILSFCVSIALWLYSVEPNRQPFRSVLASWLFILPFQPFYSRKQFTLIKLPKILLI